MRKIPDHYSLVKEHERHFELHDGRHNKTFNVAKKGLHPAHQLDILRMKKMSEGGEVDPEDTGEDGVDEGMKMVPKDVEAPPPALQALSADEQATPAPEQGQDWQGSVGTMPGQPTDQPVQAAPTEEPATASLPGGYPTTKDLNAAIEGQIKGKQEVVSATQQQNNLMAEQYKKNIEMEQHFAAAQQQRMAQYQAQYDSLTKEVAAGKIDPDNYWHHKSTGSKIGAAIGLILGGIGSGLTGQPNAALQVLNKHIENDIDAQKENLGNKRPLLSENLRMQGNMMSAMNATRLQMASIAEGKLHLIAAQTGNPIIQARATQQANALRAQMIPLQTQLASNEISMQLRKDIMGRMQKGAGGYDMQDLARAGMVDKATAEKEGAAISKRQQAEAEVKDALNDLWKEQEYMGGMKENILPNIANPQSWAREKMARARVIQAIQAASPSKRLNETALELQIDPFISDSWRTESTRKAGINGILNVIRSHADPTPMAAHWGVPGAISGKNSLAKKYDMGPVK